MTNLKSLIYITYLLLQFASVAALPNGSPVCTVGGAAPQSLHLTRPSTVTGPIPNNQFQVKIGNLVLDSTIVNRITPSIDLSVQLVATGTQFRGVLVVLNKDGINLSSNLRPTVRVKSQSQCPNSGYSGFTHVDDSTKSSVEGTLFLDPSITAFLDVNIVIRNNEDTGSLYYYTRYEVSTIAQSLPTAPASTPISAPVAMPIPAPVRAPASLFPPNAPIAAPVSDDDDDDEDDDEDDEDDDEDDEDDDDEDDEDDEDDDDEDEDDEDDEDEDEDDEDDEDEDEDDEDDDDDRFFSLRALICFFYAIFGIKVGGC